MRTTIHDVARAAGTSITTVSRALNGTGRVASGTRRAVIEVARDLDYRPGDHPAAHVSYSFAVVVPDITNPFFPELLQALSRAISEAGSLMLVSPATSWQALAALRRKGVDGMVLVGTELDGERLRAVTSGIPVVALDRDAGLPAASVVRSDHDRGGELAAEHVLGLGHRRIALVAGPAGLEVSARRRHGFERAMAAAGVAVGPEQVVAGDFDEPGGYRAVTRLLAAGPPPTAMVVGNDLMALGALSALRTHGLAVPEDVSVVGFDDIAAASYSRPRLTTVAQHAAQLGTRAARLVHDLAHGGADAVSVQEILPVELVFRESTAPPRPPGDRP